MADMPNGKLWTQRDRFGNDIYLTCERWNILLIPIIIPKSNLFDYVRETIREVAAVKIRMIQTAINIIVLSRTYLTTTRIWLFVSAFDGLQIRMAQYTKKSS
jgi:hypothetical protein